MTYYYGMPYSDELYHHGIKGMKWGVRRFQNSDGSLTPAGEKRYYGKANAIQRDIDSFKPVRNGIKTKRGKTVLTKQDIDDTVRALESVRDKARAKGDARRKKDYAKLIASTKNDPEFKKKTETAKKVAIGAAVVAGVALAAYGGYKLSKSEKFNTAIANKYLKKADKSISDYHTATNNATMFARRSRGFRAGMQYSNNADTVMKMHSRANANMQAAKSYLDDAEKYRRSASKYAGKATKYANRAHAAHYTGKKFKKTFGEYTYKTIRR